MDACKIEHLISDLTAEALAIYIDRREDASDSSSDRDQQVNALEDSIREGRVEAFPGKEIETISERLQSSSEEQSKDKDDE